MNLWFSNIRMHHKLALFFSLPLALILTIATLAEFGLSRTNNAVTEVIKIRQPVLLQLQNFRETLERSIDALGYFLFTHDPLYARLYRENLIAATQLLESLRTAPPVLADPDAARQLNQISAALNVLGQTMRVESNQADDPGNVAAKARLSDEILPLSATLQQAFTALTHHQIQSIQQAGERLTKEAHSSYQTLLGWSAISILLSILLTWLAIRLLVRPLRITNRALKAIAEGEGDLSRHLPTNGCDELAELASHFNGFVRQLSELAHRIARVTGEVIAGIATVADHTSHITLRVIEQEQETTALAAAMEQMGASIGSVADSATEAESCAANALRDTLSGRQVVLRAANVGDRLVTGMAATMQVIETLERDSNAVGGILDVIKGVAEQTNLLALNASIEAARAGEQGRGFAVVADEVRGLANRTQQSISDIQDLINRVQSGARQAVTAILDNQRQVLGNADEIAVAQSTLELIEKAVQDISERSTRITIATQEQTKVVAAINTNLTLVSQASQENALSAKQAREAIGHLGELSHELQQTTAKFKLAGEKNLDFQAAKAAHLAWRARLRGYLDGRQSLSETEVLSHTACLLGKWYYSDGIQQYGHIPEMRALEAPHEELHRTIREIVQLRENGHLHAAEQRFTDIERLSGTIVGLLTAVETRIKQE